MITFKTKAHANVQMFDRHGDEMLRLMGMSGHRPGALMPEDIPAALDRLKKGVEATPRNDNDDDEDQPRRVDLAQRAWPLIQLLEAAVQKNKDVIWE